MRNYFRMIGMVCMATAMTVCFTACSDDDETEVIENQKRLVEVTIKYINEDAYFHEKITLTYNNDGRLAMSSEQSLPHNPQYYTWGNNSLTISSQAVSTVTCTLNNNLITNYNFSHNYGSIDFKYNSSKQLTKDVSAVGYGDCNHYTEYSWQDGKLLREVETSISCKYHDNFMKSSTYKYSGKTCKGWLPNYWWAYMHSIHEDLFMAHPKLFGMRTNQLPDQKSSISTDEESYYRPEIGETQKIESKSEETTEYDYEFYPDGYLKSYTETPTSVYTRTYSFKDKNQDNIISPDERNVTETGESTGVTRLYTFKWE